MIGGLFRTLILTFALAVSGQSYAQDVDSHTIVVVDTGGTALRNAFGDDQQALDEFLLVRAAFVARLRDEVGRSDLITVISVNRPRVLWSGTGAQIKSRKNYRPLRDFLADARQLGGCADYDQVANRVEQQKRRHPNLPINEVVFFASLIHTGPSPCDGFDVSNPVPPDSFYEAMATLAADTGMRFRFEWVNEISYDKTFDFFSNRNFPVEVKSFDETLQGFGR